MASDCDTGSQVTRPDRGEDLHFFPNGHVLLFFVMKDSQNLVETNGLDLATLGQRVRHLRRTRGMTLANLGERVGCAPSALSLLENGRREPKPSMVEQPAVALHAPGTELLKKQ